MNLCLDFKSINFTMIYLCFEYSGWCYPRTRCEFSFSTLKFPLISRVCYCFLSLIFFCCCYISLLFSFGVTKYVHIGSPLSSMIIVPSLMLFNILSISFHFPHCYSYSLIFLGLSILLFNASTMAPSFLWWFYFAIA